MNLLQFISLVSGFIFLLFSIDAFFRKKLNILHFLVFFGWTWVIIIFTLNNALLNKFWNFFWLARWADLIVYMSIIFLSYVFFDLLNKHTKNVYNLSKFISHSAIDTTFNNLKLDELVLKRKNKTPKDDFVFLVRCYNEDKIIWNVIDEIYSNWFSKIIIINDWSEDNTEFVLKQKKEQYSDKIFVILKHVINRWGWAANKTLFDFVKKYSKYFDSKWFVTFDADGQMNVWDMEYFLNLENKKSDVYLGSRFINWASIKWMPITRRIVLFGAKFVTYVANWIYTSDPHNWFRIFSSEIINKIKIYSDNMTYASEILDSIVKNKIKFEEFPTNIKYTEYSLSKWQKNSNAFKILAEIVYKKLFFR